jgi:acid phosphatase
MLGLLWGTGCERSVSVPVAPEMPVATEAKPSSPFGSEGSQGLPNLGLLKNAITAYHDSGAWNADIAAVAADAMRYLSTMAPGEGKPALVLDIDETSLSNWPNLKSSDYGYVSAVWNAWVNTASAPANEPVRDLYRYAKQHQIAVFFITARPESQRAVTEKNLRAAGYDGWDGLFFQPDDYKETSKVPYKSGERRKITERGYRILANVGDQQSDLLGGYAERTFKLPNPAYYIP